MAADLEAYLQSEEAAADVAALTENSLAQDIGFDGHKGWELAKCAGWWALTSRRAEYPIRLRHRAVVVYFRPEGDRFVVSDLGEAVRALRLRTGLMKVCPQFTDALTPGTGVRFDACDLIRGGDPTRRMSEPDAWTVPAADLPRALCRVMLAAYRVARLEVPHG